VRKLYFICIGLVLCGLLPAKARADSFQLNDGQTLAGDVVSFNESGLVVRTLEGKYAERVPWTKFSQADLKRLAQNPRIAPLVEPFLEVSQEETTEKTEVELKPVPRLERPPATSLLGALFSSSVGLFVLLLLYAANIYAAYEVSIFRGRPRVLVCGLAAIPFLGVLSPLVFLAMPTRMDHTDLESPLPAAPTPTYTLPGTAAAPAATGEPSLRLARGGAGGPATASLPTTQVFQRGAFTFNRRFFETKFPGFFSIIRRDADKDMVLLFKSGRGEFVAQRITRIAANDVHVLVQKGPTGQEFAIPFTDIQEIHLKHKDA
jgi:hypothetical protein